MGKVLSAQGSGYFPSCIRDYDPPENSIITGSLEDIMSLYWRVKKFSVNASGAGIIDSSFVPLNISLSGSANLETIYTNFQNPQPNITDEASLVCGYSLREHIGVGLIANFVGFDFTISTELDFQTIFSAPSNSIYTMRFAFRLSMPFVGANLNGVGDNAVGSWSISLYGTYITGTLYAQGIDSGSFNVNFIGTEYWSYGGTYDTTTGEPL